MGLRINQNISAQTALSYVRNNDISLNRAIERLSSGLRIVRGADDPAGLIISEKHRAQVEGLGQAINNAKDGINMAQTTEGALDEVSSILRTMRNLALHAANTGPNDADAIAADQQQIKEALSTLDRIASTTQFGSKKLLDGSAGVMGTVTDSNVSFVSGSENTKANTYAVNVTQAAVKGKVASNANAGAGVARTVAQFDAANAGAGALDGTATLTLNGALTGGSAINVALTGGDNLAAIVSKINADSSVQASGLTASVSGGKLRVVSDRLSQGGAGELTVTIAAGTSTNQAAVSGLTGAEVTATANAGSASKLRASELLTFTNGVNTINVNLTAGTTMSAAVNNLNNALDAAGIKMTASFDATNARFVLENDEYGSSATILNAFSSNATGAQSTGLAGVAGTSYNVAASGAVLSGAAGAAGQDVAGTIGGFAATGEGQFLTGASGTDVADLQLKITAAAPGAYGSVTVANNSLKFQVGAFADQTVSLAVDAVSTNILGRSASGTVYMGTVNLASIDVTTNNGGGAQDAIRVLDAAISQVSTMRSKLGSFQKDVLETTVRNLGVAQQNIMASESNIRDADFAEEMLKFSRGQILAQTGFSMLTQANQSAQQVLRLFS
ncbi:MAG: flagellin [Candidatus Eremiobacterota bacterium]